MITRTCDKCPNVIRSKPWLVPQVVSVELRDMRNVEAHLSLSIYDSFSGLESDADICESCLKVIFNELCRQSLKETDK